MLVYQRVDHNDLNQWRKPIDDGECKVNCPKMAYLRLVKYYNFPRYMEVSNPLGYPKLSKSLDSWDYDLSIETHFYWNLHTVDGPAKSEAPVGKSVVLIPWFIGFLDYPFAGAGFLNHPQYDLERLIPCQLRLLWKTTIDCRYKMDLNGLFSMPMLNNQRVATIHKLVVLTWGW